MTRHIPKEGESATFKNVAWKNKSGGTMIDFGRKLSFRAKVMEAWHDYEVGWRFRAVLLEDVRAVDSAMSRRSVRLKKGTTVYVGEFDLVEEKP